MNTFVYGSVDGVMELAIGSAGKEGEGVKEAGGSASFSGSVIGASYTTAFIGVFMLNSAPFNRMPFRHLTIGCLAVLPHAFPLQFWAVA